MLQVMELHKKLKLKTDQPIWLINAPADCIDLFAGIMIKNQLGKEKPVGQLIVFVTNSDELSHYLLKLADYVGPETLFWIFYPKKSGSISSDLGHMQHWEAVFKMGYRGQTSVAVTSDWTGFRLTNAPKVKASIGDVPMEERKIEGIDFVNRTVKLPADALEAVSLFKGLAECFDSLSFTAKKEYVIAITESKKEETRVKRIGKMIEELKQKMHTREAKGKLASQ
jgi:hypothetical protein